MYCTGGIRCDIYSAFLKQRGFNKLYTLEGGIQNYLVHEGRESWNGSLFVFDGRMAISAENPGARPPLGDRQCWLGALPLHLPYEASALAAYWRLCVWIDYADGCFLSYQI